ncbi:MAG: YfiR family protein [Acidobacteriota bacterium]
MKRSPGICRLLAIAALVAVLPTGAAVGADAPDAPPTEHLVKAAFVYYFAQFVEWPGGAFLHDDSPVVIGLLGDDELSDAVEASVQKKTAGGRPFVVRRLGVEPALKLCHIVVVSASQAKSLDKLAAILDKAPVLTVGESDGFARGGGMINLVLDHGKVRMEINAAAAARVHLAISSRVLKLATIVP